jgi:hypothetical protein
VTSRATSVWIADDLNADAYGVACGFRRVVRTEPEMGMTWTRRPHTSLGAELDTAGRGVTIAGWQVEMPRERHPPRSASLSGRRPCCCSGTRAAPGDSPTGVEGPSFVRVSPDVLPLTSAVNPPTETDGPAKIVVEDDRVWEALVARAVAAGMTPEELVHATLGAASVLDS